MRICPDCGREFENDIRHCESCGTRLFHPETRPCPKCGIVNDLGTRYCKGCGNALMPSVVAHRKPSTGTKPRLDSQSEEEAALSNNPQMPEWITRFRIPKPRTPQDEPPQDGDSTNQLMTLLHRMLGISPDEMDSIQIRKRNGETIDLPTQQIKHSGTKPDAVKK